MSYKDPETGKVFEDIEAAMEYFCYDSRRECGGCNFNSQNCRKNWINSHPAEAARLMGYEVIEDEKDCGTCVYAGRPLYKSPCSECRGYKKFKEKKEKPRLAEVLGVEVEERFYVGAVREYPIYVDKLGDLLVDHGDGKRDYADCATLCALIQHPDYVTKGSRLTEAELAICKACGAKYIARDKDSPWVTLHLEKPEQFSTGCYSFKAYIGTLDENLFPSVALGDCICVEEAETCG